MVRRSPAESYIKYLVVHPNGYTNAQVKEALLFAKLDGLGDWYVDRLRAELVLPQPFYPTDGKHKPSMMFLLAHGLHDFFFPDDAVRAAFKIIRLPRVKEWIEAMLFIRVPMGDIADQVTRFRGHRCTAEVIKRYRDIFCNVDLLDVAEMQELQELRITQLETHPDKEIRAQAEAAKKTAYKNPARVASQLPTAPTSAMIAMMSMGVVPLGVDENMLLAYNRRMILHRLSEVTAFNSKDSAYKTKALVSSLRDLGEFQQMTSSAEDEMRKQIQALHIQYESVEAPTIRSLTGGNHTQNLEPERKADEPPTSADDSGVEGEEPFV